MTNQELAQEIANRMNAAKVAAEAAGDKALLRQLKRAHGFLDRAQKILMPMGDITVQSGSGLKP
jgi:hypothetical protein